MDKPVKIFATDDRLLIHHLKNSLQSAGIDCFIKNDMIYSLAGEVPVNEVWPEIWIKKSSQKTKAQQLLESIVNVSNVKQPSWICEHCGEKHDGQFTSCWRCGKEQVFDNEGNY